MILKEKKTVYFEVKQKSELSDPLWGREKMVWAKAAKHTIIPCGMDSWA